jgi:hypothetical protein
MGAEFYSLIFMLVRKHYCLLPACLTPLHAAR